MRRAIKEQREFNAQEAQRKDMITSVGPHFRELAPYAEEAARNGTNLPRAVATWSAAEAALVKDPPGGTISVLEQAGYNPFQVIADAYRQLTDPATIN
jgi:hypothetical protein